MKDNLKKLTQKDIEELFMRYELRTADSNIYFQTKNLEFFWSDNHGLGIKLLSEEASIKNERPSFVNILSEIDKFKGQFQQKGFKKEPLFKAIGLKAGDHLIDATCGMGKDSAFFLAIGLKVKAYEREPLVYLMLATYLDIHKQKNEIFNNFELKFGNVIDAKLIIETLYYDPMYEDKNEKALPQKNMRIFRSIILQDPLLETDIKILFAKVRRFIVKRPLKSVAIMTPITASFEGKSTRYDVFINHEYTSNN